MSLVKSRSRALPERPNLEQLKKRARALLRALHLAEAEARERWAAHHPRAAEVPPAEAKLADALLVLAREHGFPSFPQLKAELERRTAPEPVVNDGSRLPVLLCERPLPPFGSLHLDLDLTRFGSGLVLVHWREASRQVASIAELTPLRGANGASRARLDYRARARFDWHDEASALVRPIVERLPPRGEAQRMCERILSASDPLSRRNEWVSRSDLEALAGAGELGTLLARAAEHCGYPAQQALLEARDPRQMVALLVSAIACAEGPPNPRPPADSAGSSASLVVLHAAHHPHLVGRRYPLSDEVTMIGRAAESRVPLLSAAISRQHARIVRSGSEHVLEDNGSTNGSFLNDAEAPLRRTPLSNGDRVKVGDAILGFVTGEDADARCRELARHAADYDALTLALRARSFWLECERAVLEARGSGAPLALLHFELAEPGALRREALLSLAADSLRRGLGSEALIGRGERDQLLVTLLGYDEPRARRLAEQLPRIEGQRWGHAVSCSASFGIAVLRATGGVGELLAEAERSLARVAA